MRGGIRESTARPHYVLLLLLLNAEEGESSHFSSQAFRHDSTVFLLSIRDSLTCMFPVSCPLGQSQGDSLHDLLIALIPVFKYTNAPQQPQCHQP